MNKTRQNTMEMQTLVLGLLAVWGGATMTLDFICTGAAPVKGAWTPTVAQAKNALHRYIKDAVANRKVASNLPVKCDHAGAIMAAMPCPPTYPRPALAGWGHFFWLGFMLHARAKSDRRPQGI